MEIQEISQECIFERILDDKYQFTFKSMYPICKVTGSCFDGFIQPISHPFPGDDHKVSKNVKVIPFITYFRENPIHRDTGIPLIEGEHPADNWSKHENHSHHDPIGTHA